VPATADPGCAAGDAWHTLAPTAPRGALLPPPLPVFVPISLLCKRFRISTRKVVINKLVQVRSATIKVKSAPRHPFNVENDQAPCLAKCSNWYTLCLVCGLSLLPSVSNRRGTFASTPAHTCLDL
jgi:hypothetical protein